MKPAALLLLVASGWAADDTWLTYGKNPGGWRYSDFAQINLSNVASLAPKWLFQTGVAGKFETTPLVFDGMMFVTAPANHAYALDLRTGRRIWSYHKPLPVGLNVCCGQVNRGFAVSGNKLFKVNLEATLVALDTRSGRPLWETRIDDFKKGYSATVAPLVVNDLVVVGIAGAEFGVRGFIDAYHIETGKRAWRFWTVAGEGEPGGETWGGESWKRGGGSTWITGTYDPDLNLVYWGTGNPGPDLDGDVRPGDNLYTCSLVALDAASGKLKWHYQFTPHDVHDWDAISDPILLDITVQGRRTKAVAQANRNGFFYLLDRATGKLLHASPYTKVTWADSIGTDGRPVLVKGQEPSEEGTKSCPSMGGGHNWQATTFSPRTALYYFSSTEGCHLYYKTKQDFIEGQWFQASTTGAVPRDPTTGAILAVEPASGEVRWRFPMVSPPTAGMLATAGGLVFTGDAEGYLIALDARTGKPVWHFQTGGPIFAPPVTYSFEGRQYLAVAAGSTMMVFGLP